MFWWGSFKEGDRLEDLGVNGRRKTMYTSRNIQARLCNYCCSGKLIRITYSECGFLPLVMQHQIAFFLRSIILPSVACLPLPHIPQIRGTARFSGKKLFKIKSVF